jgi:HEAT repeat protein
VPDPRALPLLEELATDGDARPAAVAFAAGRVGVKEAATLLDRLLLDPDDEVAAWACHGLARLGVPRRSRRGATRALRASRGQARLLPDLHRFATDGTAARSTRDRARRARSRQDPLERQRALRAPGTRSRGRRSGPRFLRLLADGDADLRALAARGSARWARPTSSTRCAPRCGTPSVGVAIAALDAGAAIVRAGRAAPPAAWRSTRSSGMADAPTAVRGRRALRIVGVAARSRAGSPRSPPPFAPGPPASAREP